MPKQRNPKILPKKYLPLYAIAPKAYMGNPGLVLPWTSTLSSLQFEVNWPTSEIYLIIAAAKPTLDFDTLVKKGN